MSKVQESEKLESIWGRRPRILVSRNGDRLESPLFDDEAIAELEKVPGDFAASLLEQYRDRHDLSLGQWFYVHKLVVENRVQSKTAESFAPLKQEGMKQIHDYVVGFGGQIKLTNDGGELVLYRSEKGKHTDAVQVKGTATDSRKQEWHGRIEKVETGYNFVRSRRIEPWANELLVEFCDRPVEVIKRSSEVTGKCIFSDKRLTDLESIELGYYRHYGEEFGLVGTNNNQVESDSDPIPFP